MNAGDTFDATCGLIRRILVSSDINHLVIANKNLCGTMPGTNDAYPWDGFRSPNLIDNLACRYLIHPYMLTCYM